MKNLETLFRKHGTKILTGASVISAGMAVYSAIQNTRKYDDEKTRVVCKTKKDKVMLILKHYYPTIIFSTMTGVSILALHTTHVKKEKTLAGAYLTLQQSMLKYRDVLTDEQQAELMSKQTHPEKTNSENVLYYDELTNQYKEMSEAELLQVWLNINERIASDGWLCVNEYCDYMGMERVEDGFVLGWSIDSIFGYSDIAWLGYEETANLLSDGLEVVSIRIPIPPTPDYLNEYGFGEDEIDQFRFRFDK